ncbi:DNA-binding protein RFX2 isoform X3 [Neodiprion pinetum]|uniref:DNA-binding protein RFX2 isoform X3 n=1 Tax=Neodiprion lecontei TaxID=441921 RepID=A0ABM3G465_NEOLC|nr:DNA-binding protein RFX2 isoform X3 [Neodiprion fabricii]XP_046479814.1 DNA-binding protein RFX2 isoform X3 [Neodiprion pinetum]XP_046595067.1 DNA-binding protein RFX2 isoform X3 [Neodiprion lecontei]XP_046617906.1 DNA-binding protein RFX2 isoform X3 [Neodiprion virginianus]
MTKSLSQDTSLQKRGAGGGDSVAAERVEGVITMTTTGAQYALATSAGAGGGGDGTSGVGVDSKSGVVVVTTSSSSGSGSAAQTQSTRGQQLITVVTSPDPSSPNSLQVQPIQLLVQDSLETAADSSNGSSGTSAHVTAQVVVNTTHSGQHTLVDTDAASTGAGTIVSGSPHYITVTGTGDSPSYASLTTAVVSGDAEAVGSESVSHPTYVQYVEGDTSTYIPTNGQMTYPVYAVGEAGAMYTPASSQYYTPASTPVTYTQVTGQGSNATTGQLLSQGNGTYLIQQSVVDGDPTTHALISATAARASPQTENAQEICSQEAVVSGGGGTYLISGNAGGTAVSVEEAAAAAANITHATRVSQATVSHIDSPFVQWLLENYETADGVSLPRSTLYNHYLRHCSDNKLDPVNAASFGKLIRSVFLGLRTRRLGTRGNSKYHYYGIRVKPSSPLIMLNEDGTSRQQQSSNAQAKRFKFVNQKQESAYDGNTHANTNIASNTSPPQYHQYLGEASGAIPEFPEIDVCHGSTLPDDCTLEDIDTFRSIYREHCEAFLDAVLTFEFATVESLWREFWRSQDNNNGDECEEEKYLSKTKLYQMCKCSAVQDFIRRVDYTFYQNLVEVLMPDVLRPIPSSLTQSIRNFAKGLESWLTSAMHDCPEEMMQIKLTAVSAFAQTLRRYTSLNHLAQAARAVLQNSSQINQMLADLNRVDFHNVQEQASWVCQCDYAVVQRLEADFKVTLQQQNSLEQWAVWLKGVVTQVLKPYEGKPTFAKAARQFLLKWSFYSSMVIRDLTLRSAASFGSFHLIRLLYDEYMFYLIEHQVAVATGTTPIAVMGDKNQSCSLINAFAATSNGGVPITYVDVDMATLQVKQIHRAPSNQSA